MLWLAFIFIHSAHAEYRAFELLITNTETGTDRTVISTLDPRQYRGYHPVAAAEIVQYTDTWMCRGNTSGMKAICAKPEDRKPAQPKAAPAPTNTGPSAKPRS